MVKENQVEKEENPEFRPVLVNVEGNTTTNEEERTDDEKDSFLKNTNSDKDEKQTNADPSFPLGVRRLLKDGLELGKSTTKLSKAFSLIQNNSITLRNLVVAGATFGLERLLNAEVFSCPVRGHEQYGFAYLFAPVFILFCANLIAIGEIWTLSSRMYVKRYRRRGDCVARVLPSLLKACVGPAVWLVASLQDGDYYVCATVGPLPAPSNLTRAEEIEDTKSKIEKSKTESLILSWIVLVVIVFLGTAMIVWKHCFLKDNLLMKNLYEFERREALSAMKTFTEYMKGDKSSSDGEVQTSSYGREDEKVKLYEDGIPEMIGRKTVEKLFEGCHDDMWADGHRWHYVNAYKTFREMYPRISTGSPLDPWRVVVGDVHGKRTQKTCRFKWAPHCISMSSSWGELRPLNLTDLNPNMKEDVEKESCV